MGPENGINLAEVNYFPLDEYVKRIRLNSDLLEHMEETNVQFDKYLKILSQYDDYSIIHYWISYLNHEMKYSQAIEKHHYIPPKQILENDVFFDTLQMSHKRIKDLHQFVTNGQTPYEYRTGEVRVSAMMPSGEELIYWKGAKAEDVKLFMDDFITICKTNSLSVLNTNPFLKSALLHLLFVRIHPFSDGNGRTARIIHNIRFTEAINRIYGMRLKVCPLNLSQSILMNQPTYAKRINNIYFDLEHDSNDEINKWFDFILNMVDEQLNYSIGYIPQLEKTFENIAKYRETDKSDIPEKINKMKIKL